MTACIRKGVAVSGRKYCPESKKRASCEAKPREQKPRCDLVTQSTHRPVGANGLRAGNSHSNASGTRGPSAVLSPAARAAGPGHRSPCGWEHGDSGLHGRHA